MAFNSYAAPKVPTDRFKLYIDIGEGNGDGYEFELQGRGITNWTIDRNNNTNKQVDVLRYVDIQRGVPQPTQNVTVYIRSDSKFAEIIAEADYTGDETKLNAMNILHKFEYLDGKDEDSCKAKLNKNVFVEVVSFNGEADNYLNYTLNFHYSNDFVLGTMPKKDSDTITFTPDSAA